MVSQNLIYAPDISEGEFRCRVPLKDTRQMFIVNGRVQGGDSPFSFVLGDGRKMDHMLQIITVRNADMTAPLETSENFSFGEGASARLLQCSHTFSLDEFTTDEKVSMDLKAGADVEFYVMQNEHNKSRHYTQYDINLAEGASLRMIFISLHGGVISNRINVSLNGRNAAIELSGLYLTDSRQLMDNYIDLNHLAPGCRSNQLFKGILDDEGVTKFYGRINVARDSQKTEAFQANHNLLLSDRARAHSKPQLEIYADDVKCSHGATVGRLNEDELFYMRTRGIPAKEAKLLQQMAFAYEVLERISNPELRERIQSLVEKRLRGEFAHCRNCSRNCC